MEPLLTRPVAVGRSGTHLVAKVTGKKTGNGQSVGLFIPLPPALAKKFPSLGTEDPSPSHVTFLLLGKYEDPKEQKKLVASLQKILGELGKKTKAALADLDYFDHEDGTRVPHVRVKFDQDLAKIRSEVKRRLLKEGLKVEDSYPRYKPHVTLAYLDGKKSTWDKGIPTGSWDFDSIEVWGLPKVHSIKLGPSKTSSLRTARVCSLWLRKQALQMIRQASHRKNIALMRWLSDITKKLGVANHVYVVGGAVRNFLIDRPIKDLDLVIDTIQAHHDSEWLAKQISRHIPTDTNLTTNQYGVAILTVKGDWFLGDDNMRGEVLEIANARKESYGGTGGKGYKPHMVAPATIKEDLLRREFTMNTLLWRLLDLAKGPEKAQVIDLLGCGKKDLENRVLKCPRDPDVVFSDDPTRMLRALKFTGKYGFRIPPDLARAIKRNAQKMKRMPWEAVAKILVGEILSQPTARKSLKQLKDLGLLKVISEMIQEQKPFATFMANQLRKNRKVQLLLDLLELGVPASTPISFLDRAQQQRLRDLTVGLPENEAVSFVNALIKPPVDNKRVIDVLKLPPANRRHITPTARHLILQNPDLAKKGQHLTDVVIQELRQ